MKSKARTVLRDELAKANSYARQISRIAEMQGDPDKVAAANEALAKMTGWGDDDWKGLQDAVRGAFDSIPKHAQQTARIQLIETSLRDLAIGAPAGAAPLGGAGPQPWPWYKHWARAIRKRWKAIEGRLRPGWLLDRYRAGEGAYIAFVFFAAILTGLNTNYLSKATFGSPSDYATLSLWGLTAATVLDLAKTAWVSRISGLVR